MVKETCRLTSGMCASDRLALLYSQRRVSARSSERPVPTCFRNIMARPPFDFRDGTRMETNVSHPVRGKQPKNCEGTGTETEEIYSR